MQRVALVTGASSGIGEATVMQMLGQGMRVFAAARRLDRMRSLESAGATLLELNLCSDDSTRAAVAAVERAVGRIDVLVNNAGYGAYGALEDVPPDEARRQFDVNVFGLARMIQLVTPLMRGQGRGTIVNVSSIGGRIHEPMGSWYHATKFAVEGLSNCLRMELAPFGIDVVVVQPGAIRTEWNAIARDSLMARSGTTAYAAQARAHAAMLASADASRLSSPPNVVASTILRAINARRPRTRYATGGGARMTLLLRAALSDRMFDTLMRMASARAATRGLKIGYGEIVS